MSLAPIILFVYNRPRHTEQTLEALSYNELANNSILYIFADGAKANASEEQLQKIQKVRKIIRSKKWCKEVIIIESKFNKGLANAIINGVSKVIDKHGKIIVLEDDILTSKYFLQYMNDSLNSYEKEQRVFSIGAMNFFATGSSVPETFFSPVPDCWGWATWKNRWEMFEQDGSKLLEKLRKNNLISSFNMNGAYNFEQMLIDQIKGKNNSWAIRWQAVAYLNNFLTLYPKKSVTKNIGFDEEATHYSLYDFNKNIIFATNKIKIKKIDIILLPHIIKMIEKSFKSSVYKSSTIIKIKAFLKYLLPPIVGLIYNQIRKPTSYFKDSNLLWSGNYNNWEEAYKDSIGYDSSLILEKVRDSTLQVKNGLAVYERDSVLFDTIQYAWPLLACLLKIAAENHNNLNLVDFGGSLGSSYFQNRAWLAGLEKIRWNVVEQTHFVKIGQKEIANDELQFYYHIKDVIAEQKPTVLLLSGVLQCISNPFEMIKEFLDYKFDYIIIDRTAFISDTNHRITIQNVPESIYKASYPAWFFNEDIFLKNFEEKYELVCHFESHSSFLFNFYDGKQGFYKGFLLKRK